MDDKAQQLLSKWSYSWQCKNKGEGGNVILIVIDLRPAWAYLNHELGTRRKQCDGNPVEKKKVPGDVWIMDLGEEQAELGGGVKCIISLESLHSHKQSRSNPSWIPLTLSGASLALNFSSPDSLIKVEKKSCMLQSNGWSRFFIHLTTAWYRWRHGLYPSGLVFVRCVCVGGFS